MRCMMTSCVCRFGMGQLLSGLRYIAAVAIVALAAGGAYAGPDCPCDGDANIDGVVDWNDEDCFVELLFRGSSDCPNTAG